MEFACDIMLLERYVVIKESIDKIYSDDVHIGYYALKNFYLFYIHIGGKNL